MKFHPTQIHLPSLWPVFIFVLIILSCSKDSDIFHDAVLNETFQEIEERQLNEDATSEGTEGETSEEPDAMEEGFESRTTTLYPSDDAHIQNGQGYNRVVMRLDQDERVSYLLFDLSPVENIGGYITEVALHFTVNGDEGDGQVNIYKGLPSEWTEHTISDENAPEIDILLGSIDKQYESGNTEKIILSASDMIPEETTLILLQESGDDLAIASKEHANVSGPRLVVTYNAPEDAEAIVSDDPQAAFNNESAEDDGSLPDDATNDDPTNDNTSPQNEAPVSKITADVTSGDAPLKVSFNGSNSTDDKEIVTYSWNFKDGNFSSGTNPQHTFTEAGTYAVKLTVVDEEGMEDTATLSIKVEGAEAENEAPVAKTSATPTSGVAPLQVAFTGTNSTDDKDIVKYSWNFKDGASSSSPNPSHTFDEAGTYQVKLTVEDDEGLTDTSTVTINVATENEAPVAKANANPKSGTAPLTVSFNAGSSTDDNGIQSYSWDFKDGDSSSQKNPQHTFTEAGTYVVQLTIEDEEGLENTDTVTITVDAAPNNEAPIAKINATPLSGDAPLEVSFTGSNSSDDTGIEKYSWNFKDGGNSSGTNPDHTFTEAGEYLVELTVTDEDGLSDKASVTISVNEPQAQNEAPVAVANATPLTGEAPLSVQFNGSSSTDDNGISSYRWDFGINNPATAKNPSRTFNDPGVYEVQLTITDADGLTDTDTVTITVNEANSGGGNYPPGAVLASSFGFNANDATDSFKNALLSNNSTIVVDKQNSDWIIRPTTLANLNNKTIIFESGVVLRAKAGAYPLTNNVLLRLNSATNLTIEGYGATFKMNKNEYTSGEWRHTLSIRSGNNVTVKGLTLRDSGGDGISVSGISSGSFSQNITIEDVICTNNRRNGLTITSARDVWVRNSEFNNSNGTNPETGVDLEPNLDNDRLVNINFINCKFSGNDSAGFQLGTHAMNSSSIPIDVSVVDCEFSNNSRSPNNSKPITEILISQGNESNPVKGNITFERTTFTGSNGRILFSRKSAEAYTVEFRNCNAYNVVKQGDGSPISLEASSISNTLGGFTFTNFHIQYNRNLPFMQLRGPSTLTMKNINGSFTIDEPYNNPLEYVGSYNPSNNVNVNINYQHN